MPLHYIEITITANEYNPKRAITKSRSKKTETRMNKVFDLEPGVQTVELRCAGALPCGASRTPAPDLLLL
jgi:hypothetical protein